MPISRPNCLSRIMGIIWNINPTSILDVGVGFGASGTFFREYTDIRFGRFEKWQARIDGIEIFEKYRNPLWEYIYDRVIVGDAFVEISKLSNYDIIFLGDILEHFEKDKALILLNKCIKKADRFVIIVTPATFRDSSAGVKLHNNPYERHRCLLEDRDFPVGSKIERFGLQKLITIPIEKDKNGISFCSKPNINQIKDILDGLKIPYFLMNGNLLEATRGDKILHNNTDFDIGVLGKYQGRTDEIVRGLTGKGFIENKRNHFIYKDKVRALQFSKNGHHVDILFIYRQNNEAYFLSGFRYTQPPAKGKFIAYVYPRYCFESFDKAKFRGVEFNIPSYLEEFLASRYGKNWRIPNPTWNYLNQKDNSSLQPNYKIKDIKW